VIEPLYTLDVSLRHIINKLYKQIWKNDACGRTYKNVRLLIAQKIIDNCERSKCRIEQRKKYRALSKEVFRLKERKNVILTLNSI